MIIYGLESSGSSEVPVIGNFTYRKTRQDMRFES